MRALLLVSVLAVVAVACGSDDGEDTGGAPPTSSSPSSRALTVEEARAAASGEEVVVTGALFVSDADGIRLCGAILESFPPQCGEPSLVVTGLDLSTVELQSADDGSVSWAEGVELTGIVEGDELHV